MSHTKRCRRKPFGAFNFPSYVYNCEELQAKESIETMAKHAKHATSPDIEQPRRQAPQQARQPQRQMPQEARQSLRQASPVQAKPPYQQQRQIPPQARIPQPQAQFMPQYQPMPPKKKSKKGCLIPLAILLVLILACAGIVIVRPAFAQPALNAISSILPFGSSAQKTDEQIESEAPAIEASDSAITEDQLAQEKAKQMHTCRLLAQCQGVDIYSSIPQDEITGVLMHQASYDWGQIMTTEIPPLDMEEFYKRDKPLQVNHEQTEGLWADLELPHLYREQDDTEMDTSIDCGAAVGTTVYAPVTGTVVAVTDYDLYDELPDVRIHIIPDDNPDLDIVLLHQSDPMVKPGDKVEAGVTPISKIRDIASGLTDVQLAFYTAGDDPGNHSHIQANDLNNQAYLDKYFDGKRPVVA